MLGDVRLTRADDMPSINARQPRATELVPKAGLIDALQTMFNWMRLGNRGSRFTADCAVD